MRSSPNGRMRTTRRRFSQKNTHVSGAPAGARGRVERPHTPVRRPALILEHTRSPQHAKFPEWENADDPAPIFPKKTTVLACGAVPIPTQYVPYPERWRETAL